MRPLFQKSEPSKRLYNIISCLCAKLSNDFILIGFSVTDLSQSIGLIRFDLESFSRQALSFYCLLKQKLVLLVRSHHGYGLLLFDVFEVLQIKICLNSKLEIDQVSK